ncbi:MAG: penicillin-binding protein activator LpoB [Bacteroidetes bacterium]|nr:penicillin-binding protein activator LpoB [Bacteroidota bacterium]
MYIKKIILVLSLLFISLMFFSCSSAIPIEKTIVVENKTWDTNDAEAIADSIVSKLLLSTWKTEFTSKRKPKIFIGSVKNLTNEEIDTNLISKNIERSFVNDGQVTLITSKEKREEVRAHRKNTVDFANKKEFKKYLKDSKADFFIDGTFNLTSDSLNKPLLKKYHLLLNVTDIKKFESVSSKNIFLIK